jgi:regulator of protease activity HflC (stomatin/prohibitin superfamily)
MMTHSTSDHTPDNHPHGAHQRPPVDMPTPRVAERRTDGLPGPAMLLAALVVAVVGIVLLVTTGGGPLVGIGIVLVILAAIALGGLTGISPGQARVVQLFGRYVGTARKPGLRWFNPFTKRRPVSTRIRNHETAVTKVNDADGNPIEIAAVVVWQVEDTARATYEVDDFVAFVNTQAETAVRHIATSYPYDGGEGGRLSLRDNSEEITGQLSTEIAARVESAGVRIVESRLTRLAYAPEIAQAMLRRQQANAVVAARQRLVEGAVGMVQDALLRLEQNDVVDLDEERKATMVSNLLVVLCGDRDAQPVVNTGSLYQ